MTVASADALVALLNEAGQGRIAWQDINGSSKLEKKSRNKTYIGGCFGVRCEASSTQARKVKKCQFIGAINLANRLAKNLYFTTNKSSVISRR